MKCNEGPIAGITVLDLSMTFPGSLAAMYLGDLGATVIKIENPKIGDPGRKMGNPLAMMDEKSKSDSAVYYMSNRNKKSITVNIKRKEGQDIIHNLLLTTDILIESFGRGTLEKIGLDYESLKEKYPKLVFCHISIFGSKGPYSQKAGHDGNCLAYSGLLSLNCSTDGTPQLPGYQLADIGGGTYVALISILAALFYKERNQTGQFVDVGLLDGALSFQSLPLGLLQGGDKQRGGMTVLSGLLPNYQIYKCKDNKFMIFAPIEKSFLKNFLSIIKKPDWLDIVLNDWEKGKHLLSSLFASKSRDEWKDFFEQKLCCISPVNTLEEALLDPHLQNRNMIITMHDEGVGEVTMIGSPFHFSKTPCSYRGFPPKKGEQTDQLLLERGFTKEQIEQWRHNRII
ncbi:CoA transferase [bacterium]|nr:CoA transferase [bacterium]